MVYVSACPYCESDMELQLTKSLHRFNGAGKGSEDLNLSEVSLALNPSRTKGNLLIMATSVVRRK